MHNAAHPPLQSTMGLAREVRRKIQWASAAQLFPAVNTFKLLARADDEAKSSRSIRTCTSMPAGMSWPISASTPGALELDERALRLRERLGCLLRRDDAADVVVVPRRSGLARRLHLRQEEIVEQAPSSRTRPLAKKSSTGRACICAVSPPAPGHKLAEGNRGLRSQQT